MPKSLLKGLAKIVGRDNVLFSRRDLLAYSYDATQHQEMPDVIVFPRNGTEISEVLKLAGREGVPVVPRGAGTGISGGTVPIKGGIVLELSRLNRMIALDTANQRAIVEPGVINLDLQDALAPLGFIYPPDPASQKSCTLGGNIGENAGGPLCFKYGVTSKYVTGMEVVLPTGEVVDFGGVVEDCPGYDLRGLLIGSEGTLGVVTRLILRILPAPEASRTMLAIFDRLEDAGQAVSDVVSAGIIPASLELMDKKMCWAIEESVHGGYPVDAEGVLLIEIAGLADGLDRQAEDIADICRKNKVRQLRRASTSAERDALWKGRKSAFGSVARICPAYLVNDVAVPRNKLVAALRRVGEIAEKHHVVIANVAHAGDGNLHPLIVYNASNPAETAAARMAGQEIMDACIAFDGTISGEHGIGLEKLSAMPSMFRPDDLAVMRRVKEVFNPDNVLNPGKLLPPAADVPSPPAGAPTMDPRPSLPETLAAIVGLDNLVTGDGIAASYKLDGLRPAVALFPTTTGEVSRIVMAANEARASIVPWGSGSRQRDERCLTAADIILNLTRMTRTIDLDLGNSSIRLEAGKSNNALQKELAENGLFFPLSSLFADSATIGGELATNASGPWRYMYGTARDLVLGLTVVTPTGQIIHPGGKTMKNVAGLDLCKVFIGSWGTLGVITEAILRLYPLPEVRNTVCIILPGFEDAFRMAGHFLNSRLTPVAIELIDSVAGRHLSGDFPRPGEGEVMLLVGVEGSHQMVERHLNEIGEVVKATSRRTIETDRTEEFWSAYREMHRSLVAEIPACLRGKASVPVSNLAGMFHAAKKIGAARSLEMAITAHCGNGILYLYFAVPEPAALKAISDLQQEAEGLGGFFAVEAGPSWLRKNASIWPRPGAYSVMGRLKAALDPDSIFNPGKMVGGPR